MTTPNGWRVGLGTTAITGEIAGHVVPVGRLVEALLSAGQLNRTVIDRTGLTGNYDFALNWTPDQPTPSGNGDTSPDANLPSLFTAIQGQLGLKLEPAKGPVKTLVIDHIEKPTEN